MRYRREIEVAAGAAATFAYLCDFANAAECQRFEYVVTELEDGSRIALRGEGEKALSDDVITVAAGEGGTRVGYEADLRLKGVYRVVEPFLRLTFRRMGDDALEGLAARLANAPR